MNIRTIKTFFKLSFLILTGSIFFIQCGTDSHLNSVLDLETGDVIMGENDWLELKVGNMPLVISAPHGGTLNPDEVADRNCRGATTVRDRNVNELAFEIEAELKKRFTMQPYIIAAHISRKKIDLNRDMVAATCGNEEMEPAWHQYHEYIENALKKAVDEFGKVIYIDLHGHGHKKQRLELGYLLSKNDLRDYYLDPSGSASIPGKSSFLNILQEGSVVDLKNLLTGEKSFGTLIENEGIAAVPSLNDPYPLSDDAYFTGGYNTRRYTSQDYPDVFGWQIEAHYQGVRDAEGRPVFAKAFANSITTFMKEYLKN